jgi:hypothetical protein
MEWPILQAGGLLLPKLVEFYQWLHTQLGKWSREGGKEGGREVKIYREKVGERERERERESCEKKERE